MNNRKRILAGAVLSPSFAIGGLGLPRGTAAALPGGPIPVGSWPGRPPRGSLPLVPGGSARADRQCSVYPVVWDNNICHTHWYVYSGQGNVAHNIFEGEASPAPPPPPPNLTPPLPEGWCWSLFIPTPCP